jgi:hypothetical protein
MSDGGWIGFVVIGSLMLYFLFANLWLAPRRSRSGKCVRCGRKLDLETEAYDAPRAAAGMCPKCLGTTAHNHKVAYYVFFVMSLMMVAVVIGFLVSTVQDVRSGKFRWHDLEFVATMFLPLLWSVRFTGMIKKTIQES